MPIYEFKCSDCGEISEFRVSGYSDSNQISCSNCGSHSLKKIISVPGLVKVGSREPGTTCCGREERCDTPPCSTGAGCCRH